MNTEMTQQLETVLEQSGLILSDAETIKQSYLPYFEQLAEIKEQSTKIDFANPTQLDESIARELRLKTVKIRTGSEALKNERKKVHLLRGNLEQDSWNLIKSTCLLSEETFAQVEKASERKEAARKAQLKSERQDLLKPYTEQSDIYPLGEMSQDAFDDLLNGMKLAHEAKIEAFRKAEEERIAKEKAEAEERERIRVENERLKAEAIQKEKERQAEIAKAEAERKAIEEKAQKERKALEAKAKAERELAEAKLKKEREANEKLQAEIKAKADAEEKAKREAEAKEKAEYEAKIIAEKKAALAPDKVKLTLWLELLTMPNIPTGLSNESGTIGLEISNKFDSFKQWANKRIEEL